MALEGTVAFTGRLASMRRADAFALVRTHGGKPREGGMHTLMSAGRASVKRTSTWYSYSFRLFLRVDVSTVSHRAAWLARAGSAARA